MEAKDSMNQVAVGLALLFLKFGHINAIECLFAICLNRIAGADGRGHVELAEMCFVLGRSMSSCRQYLRKLHRIGLVETAISDRCGGVHFELVVSSAADEVFDAGTDQHPANTKLAPKCFAA